jgi:hypothetical protein
LIAEDLLDVSKNVATDPIAVALGQPMLVLDH